MTNEPVRCGVSFENVEEFRAAFVARGAGLAFVAYPDEVQRGRSVIIDVNIEQKVRLELEGTAHDPDFDERGNTGVLVALSDASAKVVQKMDVDLQAGPLPEVFATTRMYKPPTAKILVGGTVAEAGDAPTEPLLEPGTMVDERFRIEAHLATGGMGEVYRANHVHLKRAVALKLLRRVFATDAEMWARFQREAELVSQLESVNVVRVFDFGRTRNGAPYIAMEYVEGTTLDVLLESGPLDPARATAMLAQVCEGLAEAHALGVIHRDLKPSNLMLGRRRDGSELVKILDFGIARMSDQTGRTQKQKLTQLGVVVGTPAYVSPEQAVADDLDHRTDIYSLGCVAYELLTGRPPFLSPDLAKILSMHLTAAPAPLESVRAELAAWPALCAAVLKALSKERERRFANITEFARALTVSTATTGSMAANEWQQPAPVDDWPPVASTARAEAVPEKVVAEVDDFFGSPSPSAPPPAVAPVLAAPAPVPAPPPAPMSGKSPAVAAMRKALKTHAPDTIEQRLATARQRVPPGVAQAAWLYVEVLGVPPASSEAHVCLTRALEVAAHFGAFAETSDEDGVLIGFAASVQTPSPRAAMAALAMRDAIADEGVRINAPAARMRAALVVDDFQRNAPASGSVFTRARALAGRAQAGFIVCDRLVSPELTGVVDLASHQELLVVAGRRSARRAPGELVGRGPTFDLLERRLTGLLQGVVAPMVLRGAPGSGRTAIALELAQRARKRSLVVVQVTATPQWARRPNALIAALVCSAVGIPVEARTRLLRGALDALKLPGPVIEAVLVVCGVTQPTWAFTAGQAAHALRAVLRAGAGERAVVLIIDGLEYVDEQGLEAFGELVTRPAARELTIGLTSGALAHERLAGAAEAEVPALSSSEVTQLVKLSTGVAPGPRLAALLNEAKGLPAQVLEWLAWLDERGSLRVGANAEVVDDVPTVDEGVLRHARLLVQPVDIARVLEAAVCQGETFDAQGVLTAYPRATQAVVAQAAAGRFMPLAGRRWAFQRHRDAEAVLAARSPERAAMHQRLALAQVEVGRTNPANVDPLDVGMHFVAAGDAVRAVALLQHAAEVALIRHAPHDAALALKGLADALGFAGSGATGRRIETLTRAGALALSAHDAGSARAYVDEALALSNEAKLGSPELWLVQARVLRSEARRARAADALSRADAESSPTVAALVSVERAETYEQEGDALKAMVAFEAALAGAEPARALARWHGEIDLMARIEARLGALSLQKKDVATARRLFESSATRWRAVHYPAGEARALSNLAAACAAAKDLALAVKCFGSAAEAAARSGDFLFQTRALLQLAKAQKKLEPASAAAKSSATDARRLAVALGWEQGRLEATALIES